MALFQRSQLMRIVAVNTLKIAAAAGVSLGICWFSAQRITQITESITNLRTLAAVSERRTESTAKLRADLASLAPIESALKQALIGAEDTLEFIATLESIASQATMTQRVRFGSPIPFSGTMLPVSTLDFTAELSGTKQTLARYFSLLETARYYTSINSISLNATTDRGWNGLSNIVLSGKLYVTE